MTNYAFTTRNRANIQVGTSENEVLRGTDSRSQIQIGNGGSDRIIGGVGDDVLISGDATASEPVVPPPVQPSSTPIAINGTASNDTLNGSEQSEVFTGGKGNDVLSGEGGDDSFVWNLGDGSDVIHGGAGKDTSIVNGSQDSELYTLSNVGGKAVLDRLSQTPFDITHERVGQVQLNAGTGDDVLAVSNLEGTGINALSFDGGEGNDILFGSTSTLNLVSSGGLGDDILIGGRGSNMLNGNAGNDTLVGTEGIDQFMFTSGQPFSTTDVGIDTIANFDPTQDKIALSRSTFDSITESPETGIGSADFARVDSDEAAALSTAKITYVQPSGSSTGKLFLNANGAEAGFGNGAQFAIVSGAPTLSEQNFALIA